MPFSLRGDKEPARTEPAATHRWACTNCGDRNWLHWSSCAACGHAKPPPPKEDKPKMKGSFGTDDTA